MPTISGTRTETYVIDSEGKTYTFDKTFDGSGPSYAAVSETGKNNTIVMQGAADSDPGFGAVQSAGRNVDIHITKTGFLYGDGFGLVCYGARASIVNDGMINGSATAAAVVLFDDTTNATLINNATIESAGQGIDFRGDGSVIINNRGAVIDVAASAVRFGGQSGDRLEFINHGRIETSTTFAMSGGDSNDIVRNDGRITGEIRLGDGNDVIDMRGGALTGNIVGDDGNDKLITDKASYVLQEGFNGGNDTVKSTVDYELTDYVEKLVLIGKAIFATAGEAADTNAVTLIGNKYHNVLIGGDFGDRLDGRQGNDSLAGRAGPDTFVFKTGYDKDSMQGFTTGEDKIDISGWKALPNYHEVKEHMVQNGDGVLIHVGHDMLMIRHTQMDEIHRGDFIF